MQRNRKFKTRTAELSWNLTASAPPATSPSPSNHGDVAQRIPADSTCLQTSGRGAAKGPQVTGRREGRQRPGRPEASQAGEEVGGGRDVAGSCRRRTKAPDSWLVPSPLYFTLWPFAPRAAGRISTTPHARRGKESGPETVDGGWATLALWEPVGMLHLALSSDI